MSSSFTKKSAASKLRPLLAKIKFFAAKKKSSNKFVLPISQTFYMNLSFQLTSMFNQRLDQLREEYNQKAQNFVAKDLPKVPPSGDQLLLETQIDYLHAQNKQLRRELHRDTTGSCSTSFEGAFTDSSPKSKSRGRDQPKSPNPLINFYQSLKRSKSFRRRSDWIFYLFVADFSSK